LSETLRNIALAFNAKKTITIDHLNQENKQQKNSLLLRKTELKALTKDWNPYPWQEEVFRENI
jgi:hypothetical protein